MLSRRRFRVTGDVKLKHQVPPDGEHRADSPRASPSKSSRWDPSDFGRRGRSARSVKLAAIRSPRVRRPPDGLRCALGAEKLQLGEIP